MNGLSNLDVFYSKYSLAPIDDLSRFWKAGWLQAIPGGEVYLLVHSRMSQVWVSRQALPTYVLSGFSSILASRPKVWPWLMLLASAWSIWLRLTSCLFWWFIWAFWILRSCPVMSHSGGCLGSSIRVAGLLLVHWFMEESPWLRASSSVIKGCSLQGRVHSVWRPSITRPTFRLHGQWF